VAKTLASPIWYVDRKGEVTDGQEPWFKNPIFMVEPGGKERVYVKYDCQPPFSRLASNVHYANPELDAIGGTLTSSNPWLASATKG
jgi:hypothetical protein